LGRDAAESTLRSVAPVGEEAAFVANVMTALAPYVVDARKHANAETETRDQP
jgi:hypothetical protein